MLIGVEIPLFAGPVLGPADSPTPLHPLAASVVSSRFAGR